MCIRDRNKSELEEIIKQNRVPKIVAGIINYALLMRASDIHFEPEEKLFRVRYRVDGILQDVVSIAKEIQPQIVSRVKILANLKLDESRIPQDGRFDVNFRHKQVDIRVSTLPTVRGEKVVMRLLDKSQGILSLEDLGMTGQAFKKTMEAMNKPYGIIISTGPTGSGKSTTLYAILNRISVPAVNIVTLEDPVEYEIPGINQCQIKPKIGFTFADGLRSILRQDPNVIMVGEVRDAETANMATHAALTGHLVLTTLHTNDAAGALPRLTNMGVEPFLITSSINLIIGQRLVRRICPKCREQVEVPENLKKVVEAEIEKIPKNNKEDLARIKTPLKFFQGKGCKECNQGYKGRLGIFEVLTVSSKIEDMVIGRSGTNEILSQAQSEGMITMRQDGILKSLEGLTTIDEVIRVTTSF
jgi:type IV pilus assembly protein PilB